MGMRERGEMGSISWVTPLDLVSLCWKMTFLPVPIGRGWENLKYQVLLSSLNSVPYNYINYALSDSVMLLPELYLDFIAKMVCGV